MKRRRNTFKSKLLLESAQAAITKSQASSSVCEASSKLTVSKFIVSGKMHDLECASAGCMCAKKRWNHKPGCSHVGTSRPGHSSQQGEVRQGVDPVQPALLLLLLLRHFSAVHVDSRRGANGDGDPWRRGRLPPSPLQAVGLPTNQLDRAGHPHSPFLPPPASGPCWSTLRTQVWIASGGRDYKGRRLQRWNLERRKFYFICFQHCRP